MIYGPSSFVHVFCNADCTKFDPSSPSILSILSFLPFVIVSGSNRSPLFSGGQFAVVVLVHPIVVHCAQCTLCLREREYIMRYYGERERGNEIGRKGERAKGRGREGRWEEGRGREERQSGGFEWISLIIYHTISSSRAFSSRFLHLILLYYIICVSRASLFFFFCIVPYSGVQFCVASVVCSILSSNSISSTLSLQTGLRGQQGKGKGYSVYEWLFFSFFFLHPEEKCHIRTRCNFFSCTRIAFPIGNAKFVRSKGEGDSLNYFSNNRFTSSIHPGKNACKFASKPPSLHKFSLISDSSACQ